jgi:hypothetical protein
MVFNPTFNNISVISWQSVLFVEETENVHRDQTLHEVTDTFWIQILSISRLNTKIT